jgi:hypothetical protein
MIITVKINVIPFAKMIGNSLRIRPYKNHKKTPAERIVYMPNDKSLVCFDLIVFKVWGRNAMVVQTAAIALMTVAKSLIVK